METLRKVHWISESKDKKIGKVLASYSTKATCPDSCSLKLGGCYAWGLYYLNILEGKISDGRIKIKTLSESIKNINKNCRIARHRVAGDTVGDVKGTLKECKDIIKYGLINIGYTHNWKAKEAQPLKKYFRASCESIDEVLKARSMGWGATLIVPEDTPKRLALPNGETAYRCPARYDDEEGRPNIDCNSCTLCRIDGVTINKTVMFPVHGRPDTIRKASSNLGLDNF